MASSSAIRVLHFSDVHIGIENYGRLDPKTGLNTRLADFTAALDQVVERGLAGDVDLVLFTGDAYRSRDPNPTHQREFARRIHRLSRAGVPVFLLVGNHDLPAATGRANSVDIFETLEVPNVYVGRRPKTIRIETAHGPIQIVAVPWLVQSMLFAREEVRELTINQVKTRVADWTANYIADSANALDRGVPAILTAHLVVMGATYGSESSTTVGQELVLPKSVVANMAFDYVALGHIHKHQKISDLPLTIYAGSIERVDFGEEKEKKGYVIADVERGGATYRFEETNAREFLTIRVDALEEPPTQAALREIAAVTIAQKIVRVEITTTPEQVGQIDYGEIRRALAGAYHLAGISKRTDDRDRSRVPDLAGLGPIDALRIFLQSRNTPADRVGPLLERGSRLIAGSASASAATTAARDKSGSAKSSTPEAAAPNLVGDPDDELDADSLSAPEEAPLESPAPPEASR